MGLGLTAVGRPGYINVGRDTNLPAARSAGALRARPHQLLNAAYDRGVRYNDTARSYGLAEKFLADWLRCVPTLTMCDWQHIHLHRQLAETRALLGNRLGLYQIPSVTPDSPAPTDTALHQRLAALAAEGVTIGLSTSSPGQTHVIRAALTITVTGRPLFASVQATYNLLERSAGQALAEAHAAGCTVIVKEALANGLLTDRLPEGRPGPRCA